MERPDNKYHLQLVYTTPVNSAFRAIWLVPLSRDIKYYSPPGGFRKKKMAREPHFVVKYSSYLGTAIELVLYILKKLFYCIKQLCHAQIFLRFKKRFKKTKKLYHVEVQCYPGPRGFLNNPPMGEIRAANVTRLASRRFAARFSPSEDFFRKPLGPG